MAIIRSSLALCAMVLVSTQGHAQERRDIFSDPQNLKVLPEDISRAELRATMRSFAIDLGLTCASCHVGEDDQSIFEYDFAADDKAMKLIARDMISMVEDINQTVRKSDRDEGHEFVTVNCVTCHRGQDKPRMIQDVLAEVYDDEGIEATISKYTELRDQFYGGFTFDFSADRLGLFAQSLATTAPEDAMHVHNLNVELNPHAGAAYSGRGQASQRAGDLKSALADYKNAVALDPNFAFLGQVITGLEAQLAED